MTLLTVDDFECYVEEDDGKVEYRWMNVVQRMLVPVANDRGSLTFRQSMESVIQTDLLSVGSDGKPVPCPNGCGNIAVALDGFPWGQSRYGRRSHDWESNGGTLRRCVRCGYKDGDEGDSRWCEHARSIYCPHCDGGEDVG